MKIFFFITLLFPFYTQAQTVDEYIELSTIESDRGNYLRSIDYAKKAIELDSNSVMAYFVRAVSENRIGYYNLAIEDINKCLELFKLKFIPVTDVFYFERGLAHFGLKDYFNALGDLTLAISIAPEEKDYYYHRGLINASRLSFSDAIQDFNKAISLDMLFYDAYVSRGLAYQNLENLQEAMINYTKAISLDPNQSYAYERRGMLKFALADYFGCIEDLNVSINLHSNKGEVYYIRGLAKFYNSDNLSACEDLRTAGELGIIVAYDAIKSYCN